MEKLLYHYYIEYNKKNIDLIILCLIHELRVMTSKQLVKFICPVIKVTPKTVKLHIKHLTDNEMISNFVLNEDNRTQIHYLERLGYQSIQGFYPLPKVPEYNWYHCLKINESILDMIDLVGNNENLYYIQSERRQVYEIKDTEKNKNGNVFFVSDFLLRFKNKEGKFINWYFEIELTIKTKKRYKNNIFNRYLNHLVKKEDAQLIYVTPSNTIHEELARYRSEVESAYKNTEQRNQLFSRFRIVPLNQFKVSLAEMLKTQSAIQ